MEKHRKTKQFRGKSRQYAQDDIYRCLDDIKKSVTLIFIISHTHTIVLKRFFEYKNSGNLLVERLGQHKCNDWDNNKFVVQALGRTRFSSFRLFYNKFWEFSNKFAL